MFASKPRFLKYFPRTGGPALFLVLCCTASYSLSAQRLTTPLLSGSWQATFTNPALYGRLKGRLTVGLPGLSNDLVTENITYNDLVSRNGDDRTLSLRGLPALLDERNEIHNELTIETLGIGLRGDRFGVGLSHRVRSDGALDYPKSLIEVVADGNAQFIGQTVEIAPRGILSLYHELAAGLSYALTDKIHLGARIKYFGGIADVRTSADASLRLTTGEENFALTLEQDLILNSAGTLDYNGANDVDFGFDLDGLRADRLFGSNNGIAFDLGLFADLGRLRLQAAANDLGGTISWESEVTNLTFSGTDTFSGLDVLERFFEDSVSFAGAVDSLRIEFEPTENNDAYSSKLPTTYLLGGEFDVTDRLTAGLLVVHYDRPQGSETAFAVSARYRLLDQLLLGVNYNARRNAAANVGFHALVSLGPVQLLAATDNLLTLFRQKDSMRAGLRVGAALAINEDHPEKQRR